MLTNLTGWHVFVICGVLVTIAVVVVAIIAVVIWLSRRNVRYSATSSLSTAEQLRKIGQLRDEGLFSEAEYEAKRAELMGRI
ncbi:SHOCT domain-containing protein [Cryobacterium breve]|uniref:SHOCT domain-containing protein n=1 Tax=Cryobacterium breve TaxID=1259258 RepID=A0ABY2J5G2_9MICO|nr:SHOCT domain-containing protein [Cryobacterium sp. TmT3-12]TFC99612.1 SHOCT domain-containing protein [Cryobacterium breve]